MTIHRLTVTVTVVETTTIRIAQPGDNTDEEPVDLAEHPFARARGAAHGCTGRGVRIRRLLYTGPKLNEIGP